MTLAEALALKPPATISVIGSGGKTTVIEHLARELHAAGHSVIVSTTTHVRLPPFPLIETELPPRPFLVSALGSESDEPGKFSGPSLDVLRRWSESCDFLLVEADGSRGMSLKGYRADEPVLPPWTHRTLVVVGADILGSARVHRAEILEERLGWKRGAEVTPQLLVEAVFHPDQYYRSVTRADLILNKVGDRGPVLEFLGRAATGGHLDRYVSQVLLRHLDGTIESAWPCWKPGGTVVLVLAAGRSTRMGDFKLLVPMEGRPLIQRTLDRYVETSAERVVAVLGHRATDVLDAVVPTHPELDFAIHDRIDEGMSASIVEGLRRVPADADRVVIALGDMPFVREQTLERLLAVKSEGIVVPVLEGRRGHPVVFGRAFFDALRGLRGDAGAARILRENAEAVTEVPVDDPGILLDVDRPGDLP